MPISRRFDLLLLLSCLLPNVPAYGADDKAVINDPLVAYGYLDEVYKLDPGPHLFIDWRYVYSGQMQYSMPDGTQVGHSSTGVTEDDIPKVLSKPNQVPFGIRLEAQRAESIGPVLALDKPWEYLVAYVNVIKVGDEYRMYYEALPTRNSDVPGNLCRATSKDGLQWTKPERGIAEFEKSTANNIVFSAAQARYGMHGHQVFVDPLAPAEERYKLIYMGPKVKERDPKLIERLKQERPQSVHALAETKRSSSWPLRPLMGFTGPSAPSR